MEPVEKRIFSVLDAYIDKHGFTEVAKKIDILPNNIHSIKKGDCKFTRHQIFKVAEYTNCNLNWIFGLENNKFRKQKHDAKLYDKVEDILLELKALDI